MADEKNMFVDMEHEVMDFWEKEKCFEKLREKKSWSQNVPIP